MIRLHDIAITVSLVLLCVSAPLALAQPAAPAAPPPAQQEQATQEAQAQQPDPPVQAEPKLILRELLVIHADRYDHTANNPRLLPTALPTTVRKTGRAKSTTAQQQYKHEPMPLGIVTFEGAIREPFTLRVALQSSSSRFQAFFPDEDAITGDQLLYWEKIRQATDQQQPEDFAGQGDWLADLRDSDDRLWLRSRDKLRKERFLLYDASFTFKPAIGLAFENEQYHLKTNRPEQAAPPICVLLRKTEAGWSADPLAAPWPKPAPPIAAKTADAPKPSLRQALAPIKELLAKRGYNEQEIKLALGMIASAGFDTSRFSLVYVLPVGLIDEHIQLQIKPQPDQVIRTAIVVVNNVDPNLGSQIDILIEDLGSDQWIKRDRAQRELIALDEAAIKKVQQLKNHKDPEVAFRARQILDAYDWKRSGGK